MIAMMAKFKSPTIPSVGEDVEQLAGTTVKWHNHFGKQFGSEINI